MRLEMAAPAAEACREPAPDIEQRDNRVQAAGGGGGANASRLVSLAGTADMFQTPHGTAYVSISLSGATAGPGRG